VLDSELRWSLFLVRLWMAPAPFYNPFEEDMLRNVLLRFLLLRLVHLRNRIVCRRGRGATINYWVLGLAALSTSSRVEVAPIACHQPKLRQELKIEAPSGTTADLKPASGPFFPS
jgi:hypothetical protein